MLKVYGYKGCSTCVQAKTYLAKKQIAFDDIEITETPPSKSVLKSILKTGDYELKDLFNKSGLVYREMNLKDKLPSMSESEALQLLASNGKLIKRPIATDGKSFTVGYKEAIYKQKWG
ncbi:MAG: arsenate reductase [Candidatus Omnitrophota bacterium]|jgi:arsenate reductase